MSKADSPYYDAVPLPVEIEIDLRKQAQAGGGNPGFHRTMAQIQASQSGRVIEAHDTQKIGGMTMIGTLKWVHDAGRWWRWQYFGMGKGWLATETRSTWQMGKPTGDNWRLRRSLDEYHSFDKANPQFAHEKKQEEAGLKLTARYRAAREAALRKAGVADAQSVPKADAAQDFSPVSPNT